MPAPLRAGSSALNAGAGRRCVGQAEGILPRQQGQGVLKPHSPHPPRWAPCPGGTGGDFGGYLGFGLSPPRGIQAARPILGEWGSSPSSSQQVSGSPTSPPIQLGTLCGPWLKLCSTATQGRGTPGLGSPHTHPRAHLCLNPLGQCCSQTPPMHGATADHHTDQFRPVQTRPGHCHRVGSVCVCVCTCVRVCGGALACLCVCMSVCLMCPLMPRHAGAPMLRTPCHSCSLGDRPPSSAGTSHPPPARAFVPGFN